MSERRKIFELFEENKDFFDKKVSQGIERYRKGDARIYLVDSSGDAISGAQVSLKQLSHEFRFGANLFMLDELETEEKNDKYKKYFSELFNMATIPFYWDALEPKRGRTRYRKDSSKIYRRPAPDLCLEYCEKHGIEPREHGLAYDQFFPKWIRNMSIQEVKNALRHHFMEISDRYADKIRTIEVTNEMDWAEGKSAFYEDPNYVDWCFKLAGGFFPHNQLVINECTRLAWDTKKGRTTDQYYAYIESNILKGAPIDAIGMQYHLFNKREDEYNATRRTLDPVSLYRHMDLYSRFGKPLQITEVTVPAYSWKREDEFIQADIIEKLYSLWFSHPNVEQIIYWNLIDGYAHLWNPDPQKIAASQGDMTIGENYYYGGLLRFDLSPKPAYYTIKELTQKIWHTEGVYTSDDLGAINFRGFYGKYQININVKDTTIIKDIYLSKESDNVFRITL